MTLTTMLSAGFVLLVAGGLTLPLGGMPPTVQASARMLLGMLMLVFGGALIGRALLA